MCVLGIGEWGYEDKRREKRKKRQKKEKKDKSPWVVPCLLQSDVRCAALFTEHQKRKQKNISNPKF